jgi:hypothetical protein
MLKLVNIDDLTFEPELPASVRDGLENLNYIDHLQGIFDLDADALIEIADKLYDFELDSVEGEPVFMPSDDLISTIKDEVTDALISKGLIGGIISEKIRELTRVSEDNADAIYDETSLSRWRVEWD